VNRQKTHQKESDNTHANLLGNGCIVEKRITHNVFKLINNRTIGYEVVRKPHILNANEKNKILQLPVI
jgi:hypothetical protein